MCGLKLFDKFTASAKVGRQVRASVNFPGIAQGSIATVVRSQPEKDGYILAIEWKVSEEQERPMVHWFTQCEYEEFLVEVG